MIRAQDVEAFVPGVAAPGAPAAAAAAPPPPPPAPGAAFTDIPLSNVRKAGLLVSFALADSPTVSWEHLFRTIIAKDCQQPKALLKNAFCSVYFCR